jgi:hypothetical protein
MMNEQLTHTTHLYTTQQHNTQIQIQKIQLIPTLSAALLVGPIFIICCCVATNIKMAFEDDTDEVVRELDVYITDMTQL